MIKSILDSLHDKVSNNSMTLRQAGIKLYKAGWFNFLPDDNTVKTLLKL